MFCAAVSGCGSTSVREVVAYNVSIRDATIVEFKEEIPYREPAKFYVTCIIDNKSVIYQIEEPNMYLSLERLKKLHTVSNPNQPLILDLIMDTTINKIVAVGTSQK